MLSLSNISLWFANILCLKERCTKKRMLFQNGLQSRKSLPHLLILSEWAKTKVNIQKSRTSFKSQIFCNSRQKKTNEAPFIYHNLSQEFCPGSIQVNIVDFLKKASITHFFLITSVSTQEQIIIFQQKKKFKISLLNYWFGETKFHIN